MFAAPLAYKVLLEGDPSLPGDRWCKSGHTAPLVFQHPSTQEALPNRFLLVSASASILAPERQGVYCEQCIAVATQLAKKQKSTR